MAVLGPSPQTAQLLAQLSASNRGMAPRPVPMGPVNVGPAPGPSQLANRLALAQANQTPIASPQFQDRRETGVEVLGDLAQELATGYVNQRQRKRLAESQAEAVNQVSSALKAGNMGALTSPDTMAAVNSLPADSPIVQMYMNQLEGMQTTEEPDLLSHPFANALRAANPNLTEAQIGEATARHLATRFPKDKLQNLVRRETVDVDQLMGVGPEGAVEQTTVTPQTGGPGVQQTVVTGGAGAPGEPAIAEERPTRRSQVQNPEMGQAFGASGVAGRGLNFMTESLGFGTALPEVAEASRRMGQFRNELTEIISNIEADRQTNQSRDLILGTLPELGITTTDESAYRSLVGVEERLNLIRDRQMEILQNPSQHRGTSLDTARQNLERADQALSRIRPMIDNFEVNKAAFPQTQEDYEALAPGTVYVDPADGQTYTKGQQ